MTADMNPQPEEEYHRRHRGESQPMASWYFGSMIWMGVVLIILALLLLVLSGCSSAAQDRPDAAGGDQPDAFGDATKVTVYRNANDVPNVALFCIGPMRFASTLSGGDSGKDKASALLRLPEQDSICTGSAR